MNALEAFAGGALLGGLETYSKIGEEQRKFKIDQMKQEAEYNRSLNLMRAQHGLKEVAVGADGLSITREQLEAMSPEEREKVKSTLEYQKGFGNSGMVDKATGRPLTVSEYEAMSPEQKAGTISKDFLDDQQATARQNAGIAAQEALFDKRLKLAEAKEKQKEAEYERKQKDRETAAATLQMERDFDVAQKTILGVGKKVGEEYDKGNLPEITGKRKEDVEVYSNVSRIQALFDLRTSMKDDVYAKFLQSNKELQKLDGIAGFMEQAKNSGNALQFIDSEPMVQKNPKLREQIIYMMKVQGYDFTKDLLSNGR